MTIMGRVKRLTLLGCLMFLGLLAWLLFQQNSHPLAEPPLMADNHRAQHKEDANKATAPALRTPHDLGQEAPYSRNGGRFQTDIGPRFRNETSPRIIDALSAADASGDRATVLVALATLERRGQLGDDQVPRLILDRLASFPAAKQKALIHLLGRIATPAALNALFALTGPTTGNRTDLRAAALAEIERVGTQGYDNGDFPVELSPPLEQRLPHVLDDAELLGAVAGGIASIGSAAGVEALLKEMENHPEGVASSVIAQQLRDIRNPDAVEPLAARLRGETGSLPALGEATGDALAALGDPAATAALLDWAANAEGEQAHELALRWFGQVRDDASFEQVIEAGTRHRFRDPRLLHAIQTLVRGQDAQAQPYFEGPGGD